MMEKVKRILVLGGLVLAGLWMAAGVLALPETAVSSQTSLASHTGPVCEGDNLLTNPGFEGEYEPYIYPAPGHPDCQTWDLLMPNQFCERAKMPAGWHPRWLPDGTRQWVVMPEFTQSTPDQVNPDRVRSGGKSLHYWSFWMMHEAAVFQQVTAVPGATYCFSAWGHAWSNDKDGNATIGWYSATDPAYDGRIYQRVGIDPTGGTDWQSPTVIWSDERKQYDLFGEFAISATAQANTVTVFVYSRADYPVKHNDVYWDDALLQVSPYLLTYNAQFATMTTVSNPVTVTNVLPLVVFPATLPWTAEIDPASTLTSSLIITPNTAVNQLDYHLTTTGLMTGTYTATVNLVTTQPAVGSPAAFPIKVYVLDELFSVYLPLIAKP